VAAADRSELINRSSYQAISTEFIGITIGTNELEDVVLRTATATLDGGEVSLSFTTCP
jgi:hypothetical protein